MVPNTSKFYASEQEEDFDSEWDRLFPRNKDELLPLDDSAISSLLDGVKHYNQTVPLAEVICRLGLKNIYKSYNVNDVGQTNL